MDMQEIISRAEENIRQALADYARHTSRTEELDRVSESFIRQLAHDSSYAKQDLRELFSKSPVWDANLDALVINGTRTHNPDHDRIYGLALEILDSRLYGADATPELARTIKGAIRFFSNPNMTDGDMEYSINCIKAIAPKAYAPTKKPSRVFKAICDALGVSDDTAGSAFQRLYAQFADELSAKKIGFKMYVSINPAHFLTMSNPKCDDRGNTLTSCHSFNSTEYEYNNGCSGYARDKVSFIVFTVSDPTDRETLNNRKTTRQVFAYRPGSGLLMQSRMYNTSGGVYGAAEDSKLYRDLVQREISMLEDMPNLWNTYAAIHPDYRGYVVEGDGFGGYPDWTYENFDGHISLRKDCDRENVAPLTVGTWGLCISCGCETSTGLYCDDCKYENSAQCDECGDYCDEDDLYTVHNADGDEIRVCANCRDNYYSYCERCGEYYPSEHVNYIDGMDVCDDCRDEYYEQCEDCDEWHLREEMVLVHDSHGDEVWVCERCLDQYYCCEKCDEYYPIDYIYRVTKANGDEISVCEDCVDDFKTCPHCDEHIEICSDGTCPACGAIINDENEEENA